MTVPALVIPLVRSTVPRVYTRTATDMPTGESTWTAATGVRVDGVVAKAGKDVGVAKLSALSGATAPGSSNIGFEDRLMLLPIDTQVRIAVVPIATPGMDAPAEQIIFEGVIRRSAFHAQADERGHKEGADFVALPFPAVFARQSQSLITGRWVAPPAETGETTNIAVIETPDLPAVFNAEGKRNRHGSALISGPEDETHEAWTAPVFTHDDDPSGAAWTVGQAIASILLTWVFENALVTRTRAFDVDSASWAALQTPSMLDQFYGLNAILPEVSVHGLDPLAAIEKVARAGGYEFAVQCEPDDDAADRFYVMRIWRKGSGPAKSFRLAARGTSYADVTALTTYNNLPKVQAVRDVAESLNAVYVTAPSFVEARFDLKPLWPPGEMVINTLAGLANKDELQFPAKEDLLVPGSFAARHINGGKEFHRYGYVGRLWGLDCTGDFAASGFGDGSPYHHASGGVDFVTVLGIDGSTTEPHLARSMAGVTAPIAWTRRQRKFLPMRTPAAVAKGVNFVLEASEDSGATWTKLKLEVQSDPEKCAILLPCDNLVKVSIAGLAVVPELPDPEKSWWGLICDGTLRLRVCAVIEADHGIRFDAAPRSSAGTAYSQAVYLPVRAEETWVAPGSSEFTASSAWTRISTFGLSIPLGGAAAAAAIARRRQEVGEAARQSVSADLTAVDLASYHMGDCITGIDGRDVSFEISPGTGSGGFGACYPNVVGITYSFSEIGTLAITLALSDDRALGTPLPRGVSRG